MSLDSLICISCLIRPFRYNLDPDIIKIDLENDRPIWPFSVYAPGRTAPRQLIEGPLMEQSQEEMRLRYYAAMRTGHPEQAVSEEWQVFDEPSNYQNRHMKKLSCSVK